MEFLKLISWTNIHRSWKSTLVGLLLIAAGLGIVFYAPTVSWELPALLFGIGILLAFAKDDNLPKPPAMFIVLLLTLLLSGCCSYSRCVEKYGDTAKDTIRIMAVDTVRLPVALKVAGDSAAFKINLNADKGIFKDSVSGLSMSYKKIGNSLLTKVNQVARVVRDTITKVVKVKVACPPQIALQKKKNFLGRVWDRYKIFSAWLVLVSIAFIIINKTILKIG